MKNKNSLLIITIVVLQFYSCANYTYKDPLDLEVPNFGVLKFTKRLFQDEYISNFKFINDSIWVLNTHKHELSKLNPETEAVTRYSFDSIISSDKEYTDISAGIFYMDETITLYYEQYNVNEKSEKRILQFDIGSGTYHILDFPDSLKERVNIFTLYQHDNVTLLKTTDYSYFKSLDNGTSWIDSTQEEYEQYLEYVIYPENLDGTPISSYQDQYGHYMITNNSVAYYTITNLNFTLDDITWHTSSLGTNYGRKIESRGNRIYVAATYYYEGMGFIPLIQLGGGLLIFDWTFTQ